MVEKIRVGLLGLGTVGTGVIKILKEPGGRHPLVSNLELVKIAVKDIDRPRSIKVSKNLLTDDPKEVVEDPSIQLIVEVMGGIEPARSLIMSAIAKGKSVVTANKAVIARYGEEIAEAANNSGVYVLIEAAVGGGIPIIEPLKQSLGGNKINKVTGIINGTTNYILSRIEKEGVLYNDVLREAKKLGYAEADPKADVEGLDAADKISILSGLAFGGPIEREKITTEGITNIQSKDIEYASKLGYVVKLLAVSERIKESENSNKSLPLAVWVKPTLIPEDHPLAGVSGVNNAILVEGEPIGEVMFYGPGAGAGPTASAVVADILNIAGIKLMSQKGNSLDPLLAANSWRSCHLASPSEISQKNYVRLQTEDSPGVIGKIGSVFGVHNVSIQSIVQFDVSEVGAEIVVITQKVSQAEMKGALTKIKSLPEVKKVAAEMICI